jgi:hypothetical protein
VKQGSIRELQACHSRGTLADGKPYAVNVFANEESAMATGITIMIEPAEAANSREVAAIYDRLAQTFRYDQGRLKDRFPDPKSVAAWCDAKGVHNPGRCTIVESLAEKHQAVFSVTTPPPMSTSGHSGGRFRWSIGHNERTGGRWQ